MGITSVDRSTFDRNTFNSATFNRLQEERHLLGDICSFWSDSIELRKNLYTLILSLGKRRCLIGSSAILKHRGVKLISYLQLMSSVFNNLRVSKIFKETIFQISSSLHWSFDCFLRRFSTNGAYSEWTSPLCLRHRFVLYFAKSSSGTLVRIEFSPLGTMDVSNEH